MTVYYRCKRCGERHAPPVTYAEDLYLNAAATLDLSFECPATGASAVYNRTDLLWADDGAESGDRAVSPREERRGEARGAPVH